MTDGYIRPTELEVAWGDVPGFQPSRPWPPVREKGALGALESAVLPGLLRPPCLIAFSGGRDSSAVLATAVNLARRVGLQDPVPLTRRYPNEPTTDESSWQEMVVRHLHLEDWVRIDTDAGDLLGPAATASLVRRGVLWPPLLHLWEPLIERAAGGSLMSGEGGDEVFGPHPSRLAAALLQRRRNASRSLVVDVGRTLMPAPLRRRRLERSQQPRPWLRPEAQSALDRALAADESAEPYQWAEWLARLAARRSSSIGTHNLTLLAREHDVALVQPLLDEGFLSALGAASPRLGFANRTQAMASVFDASLPPALLARNDKIWFNRVVFGSSTSDWVARWDGSGVPRHLVDAGALAEVWKSDEVHAGTALLLQGAWLATRSAALT